MTDDTELYAARINADLYHGSEWGADAAHKGLRKYFSGRDVVRERVDAVPREELEALIEDWRERAKEYKEQDQSVCAMWNEKCAGELEALLNDA